MELLKCEFVQIEFLGCTFLWHQGSEKSQISTDCNYFYFKHKHYLLIKCMEWEFKTQMAEFIKPFFNPYVCDNRGTQNILMPINRCLHDQKGHTRRLED
jgi:hypothetical protein